MFYSTGFSQEVFTSFKLQESKERNAFQIVNDSTKQVVIFFDDINSINVYRLNNEMKIIDSLKTKSTDEKYSKMIGYNFDKSNYNLFWADKSSKEIKFQSFDFDKKLISNIDIIIPFKGEKILKHFSNKNMFYVISVLKNKNILKLYEFDIYGKLSEKTIDLKELSFTKSINEETNIYGLFDEYLPDEEPLEVQLINNNYPTNLKESSKKRKMYVDNNHLIFTFDNYNHTTQVLDINLNTTEYKSDNFNTDNSIFLTNSNSFLLDDKLYQVSLSNDEFILDIKNLKNKKLNSFKATKKENIAFKNSDFISLSGSDSNIKTSKDQKKFINNLNNPDAFLEYGLGISCYNSKNYTIATIGGISQITKQPKDKVLLATVLFGVTGCLIASATENSLTYSTYNALNPYSNRNVNYINCLFDGENKHVEKDVNSFVFNTVVNFNIRNKNFSSKTYYKLENDFYVGQYEPNSKSYIIRKFQD